MHQDQSRAAENRAIQHDPHSPKLKHKQIYVQITVKQIQCNLEETLYSDSLIMPNRQALPVPLKKAGFQKMTTDT